MNKYDTYKLLYKSLADNSWGCKDMIQQGININLSECIINNSDKINLWIKNSEFKKFKSSKYPPLLDVKSIDYESLNPYDAWFLNIPLPKYHKFICIGSHGVGFTALKYFLKLCGGVEIDSYQSNSGYHTYVAIYTQLINFKKNPNNKNKFCYISLRNLIDDDCDKFYSLIQKSKALTLVSDPLDMLRNYLNNKLQTQELSSINLTCNPAMVTNNLVKYGFYKDKQDKPGTDSIPFWMFYRFMTFHDTALENKLNIQENNYINMSEIIGKQTFDTIKKLSNIFNFAKPKDEDCKLFDKKISTYNGFLPITIHGDEQDITKISQYGFCNDPSSLKNNNAVQITIKAKFEINDMDIDITNAMFGVEDIEDIIVTTDYNNYLLLKNNIALATEIRNYVELLIKNIIIQVKEENNKRLSADNVIQYFKNNKDMATIFNQILDDHLQNIKKSRPDIVESWTNYRKFQQLISH